MPTVPAPALAPVPDGPRNVHLPALLAFECAARHMNFARAAGEMQVTPTAMSKTIKQLEAQLGVRLFNRTTRSVALTEAGAQMIATLAPALEAIRQSVQQAGEASARPHGVLRINTSYVGHAALLQAHTAAFLRQYPDIRLEITIDNAMADIVAGGFDAGIRLGDALQRDMIAVPLGPLQRMVVVGAPAYFKRHGMPRAPKDLLEHECIGHRIGNDGRLMDWEFKVGARLVTIGVRGRLVVNEMRCSLDGAAHGNGLAYVFEPFAREEIKAGRLQVALERYSPPAEMFHLYYPNRGQMPRKLRAFIEFFQKANWVVPG